MVLGGRHVWACRSFTNAAVRLTQVVSQSSHCGQLMMMKKILEELEP
jgi:hypothetical protein